MSPTVEPVRIKLPTVHAQRPLGTGVISPVDSRPAVGPARRHFLMIRKCIGAGIVALACVLWFPGAAQAQSGITGVVKDTSGAVLPGVTVEAASDVLIEKTRSVITDG